MRRTDRKEKKLEGKTESMAKEEKGKLESRERKKS